MNLADQPSQNPRRNNPWEILLVAALFLLFGLFLVNVTEPLVVYHPGAGGISGKRQISCVDVFSPDFCWWYGIVCMTISFAMTLFYFYLRRKIRKDEKCGVVYPEWK